MINVSTWIFNRYLSLNILSRRTLNFHSILQPKCPFFGPYYFSKWHQHLSNYSNQEPRSHVNYTLFFISHTQVNNNHINFVSRICLPHIHSLRIFFADNNLVYYLSSNYYNNRYTDLLSSNFALLLFIALTIATVIFSRM